MSTRRPDDVPPFARWGESREDAIARFLSAARATSTHPETAALLGTSPRTFARWWAWCLAAKIALPPRPRSTSERSKVAAVTRTAKRARKGA